LAAIIDRTPVPNTRLPMPHIEQPIVSSQKSSFAVSFLEEQTIQTAQTLFAAQPHYSFDNWEGRALLFQHQLSRMLRLGQTASVSKKYC
jgi:hypothetical protein